MTEMRILKPTEYIRESEQWDFTMFELVVCGWNLQILYNSTPQCYILYSIKKNKNIKVLTSHKDIDSHINF